MLLKRKILMYLIVFFSNAWCEKNCTMIPNKCPSTKYRSIDGSCNNIKHPEWGMPSTRLRRLLPAEYGDGISSYRTSKSGKDLPNARKLSQILYPEEDIKDPKFTLCLMQYGQIITHDMSMLRTDGQNSCCTKDLQYINKTKLPPKCAPIDIPPDDPYYSRWNARCISFARIVTDKDLNCGEENKPVEQITMATSYLDLSIIYGSGKDVNSHIRLNKGGLLRTRNGKGQEWLLKSENIASDCALSPKNEICYYPSDPRLNQNPQLTLLHIIFYREHNRIAKGLAKINPHWDDNTVYEESRKINIAQHQWISYYEWLPLFLNRTSLLQNKVIYDTDGYVDDYDPDVDPSILTEHSNAAFRIHTQIAGYLNLVNENGGSNQSLRISDWYFRPSILEDHNSFTLLSRGLTTQFSLASDRYHDHEITHFWLRRGRLGSDLKAIDIERSRDVGVATYNKARALCNLSVAKTVGDLKDIPKAITEKLSHLYESPDDLDLIVGGSLEYLLPGSLVGPTFNCILMKQFLRARVGDRFWFEHRDAGFTLDQLKEIRDKTKMSKLMCDNTKDVTKMQLKAFEKIDSGNPLISCKELPRLNLSKWKE